MRASKLSELFDDALRWKASVIDGIFGKTYGRSHLGSAVHFGTAHYDRERILPDGRPDASDAVKKFKEYFDNDAGVHWIDLKKPDAYKLGVRLVSDYCTEVSHQFEFVAVEAVCEPLLMTMPNGITFELTGTTDRVYRERVAPRLYKYGIMDVKTGYGIIGADGEVAVDVHGAQLAEYELLETMATRATSFPITLPAIVMGLSTQTAKIKWREIENTRKLLFGGDDHMGYLEAASYIIEQQLYIGNPRSMLCSDRYCPIYNSCFYRIGREPERLR